VTTHSQDANGGADRRLLDCQNVHAAYIVSRDLRDNIALAFPKAKIMEDATAEDEDPPPGVTELRDIKAWIISRVNGFGDIGVIDKPKFLAGVAAGKLIVEIDDSDPTQVNIVVPFEIIQPLAKFGIVAQRVPS
jgi:phage tail sheath gpL-like